jgi:hypothetical protein
MKTFAVILAALILTTTLWSHGLVIQDPVKGVIKLPTRAAPTANGEIGYDGTNFRFREGGTNKTIPAAGPTALSGLTDVTISGTPTTNNFLAYSGAAWVPTSLLAVANGGTNNAATMTAGSILFSDGSKTTQDNSNLNYNDATDTLNVSNTRVGTALTLGSSTGRTGGAVAGDLWNDSTQYALKTFTSGVTSTWGGSLFEATAGVSVTSTSAGGSTCFPTGVGTLSLPANFWKPGKRVTITMYNLYTTTADTNDFTWQIKLGSTVLWTGTQTQDPNDTNDNGETVVDIKCRSAGESGVFVLNGHILRHDNGGTFHAPLDIKGIATVNTTLAGALDVTCQVGNSGDRWDTTDASVSFKN